MKKRILLAALLIIVTIGIGFALWWVFFKIPIAPPPRPEAAITPPITGLPPVAPGAPPGVVPTPPIGIPVAPIPKIAAGGPTEVTTLIDKPVEATKLTRDGRLAFYNTDDKRFYRLGPDGKPVQLSARQFPDIKTVSWAPGGERAILEFPDGANVLFDFNRNEQVTLPKHWEDFAFSPNGEQIVTKSIGLDPSNRWLVLASADGSGARAIESLGENADRVINAWSPNDQVVAFSATGRPQGFDRQEIYLVGKNRENFKSLIVEGRDFRPLWNPEGTKILYSVHNSENEFKPTLWLVGGQGESIGANRNTVGLNTWADKCTFTDAATAYCAVPSELPLGAGLQPAIANDIPDFVYRVDTNAGTKTLVGSAADGASMSELSVSPDGRNLFFVDNRNGQLKQMRLR